MNSEQAFQLIVEYLKRNGSDIQDLRQDIKECRNEIHEVRLKINKLESHDALMFDPEEIKKVRSEARKSSAVIGTGTAGLIVALYETLKNYFAG